MRSLGKRFQEYVVVYDISSNSERTKVDKVLKNYGFRIQKSVFECRLTESMKKKLIMDLKRLSIKTGFVKIYLLTDIVDAKTIGKAKGTIDDGDVYIL